MKTFRPGRPAAAAQHAKLLTVIRNWSRLSPDARRRIMAVIDRHEAEKSRGVSPRVVSLPQRPR